MDSKGTDWASIVKSILEADPRNFVIVILVGIILFVIWQYGKFIKAKFIDQTTKVITAAANLESSAKTSNDSAEEHKKLIKEFQEKIDKFSKEITATTHATNSEIERLRLELVDIRKVMGRLGLMNRTTSEAIEQYQDRISIMEENFKMILSTIRKNQRGAG